MFSVMWSALPAFPKNGNQEGSTQFPQDFPNCCNSSTTCRFLISAPKSTVMLFTTDKHDFQMHPDITLEDTQLPLECSPKILGVIMDPSFSFHKHCNYVSDRIDKRNNMLKALAGSSWGHEKETLLLTYNALGNLSQAMQHQSGVPPK